jgi:hypothetical protein
MTNWVAFWIFVIVAGFFALDAAVLHLGASLFVLRKLSDLIVWIAFWH